MREPELHDGKSLLQRHLMIREHIKPAERKRRINANKVYRRKVKRIEDLMNYIKFMKDNGQDWKQLK